ncbi:F-box only protein 36a [Brachyhypopomus gauderio]|uniref:F-box only protein 36a n=1 Tax=Brachyhypopomus gauderio TaxID=698409 RepID=UPI0040437154
MASLLKEVLFETNGQGQSPSKDFFQLVITKSEVIWRWWKISLRVEYQGLAPEELKQSHDEFLNDARLQYQVGTVFGSSILEYSQALCQGHFDYLERLPDQLLLRILSYLTFQDIGNLSQTSLRFKKICDSKDLWEKAVRSCSDDITLDMELLANTIGWRRIYFTFYHKKFHSGSIAEPLEDTNQPSEAKDT